MTRRIQARTQLLSDLLRGGTFQVPYHQRRYDWSVANVTDLLNDLNDALGLRTPEYFLGTVMLIPNGKSSFLINDGQQRLITFTMIAARLAQLLVGKKSRKGGGALCPQAYQRCAGLTQPCHAVHN